MSTYVGSKEIQKLKDGTWEHRSLQMVLSKKDGTETIEGPGFIRQIQQKYFQVVVFDSTKSGGLKENFLKAFSDDGFKLGEIIPATEGYELTTPDSWKSTALGQLDSYHTQEGVVHTAYTTEIFSEVKRNSPKAKAGVSFHAFHEYKGYPANKPIVYQKYVKGDENFPGWNLCVADTKCWLYDLRYFVHDSESILRLTSNRGKKNHNDKIEFRAVETLEYVLGTPFEWNIKTVWDAKCRCEHIRLVNERTKSYFNRPYNDTWTPKSGAFQAFWGLYSNYLKYTLRDKEAYCSLLGATFKNLMGLRNSSTDYSSYILALCVSIENVIQSHFTKKVVDRKRKTLVTKLLLEIEPFLKSNTKNKDLASMVKNHINVLMPGKETSKRTLDRLVSENKISKIRRDAWIDLRNRVSHGKHIVFNQKNLNSVGDIEVLLHQLIFQLIGYKGKYKDYGLLGYPCKIYSKEL